MGALPEGGWDLVLGHSLGGAIALRAGIAPLLVLEDPLLGPLRREAVMPDFDLPPGPEAQVAAHPSWHPEDARIKATALAQCGPGVVSAIVDDLADLDLGDEVAGLTTHTLVLGADHDPLVPVALGEALASGNPAVTFEVVPDSSHSIHRDAFDAFTGAIEGWLARR